jgi:transposase
VLSVDEKSQIQALDTHPAGAADEEGTCRHHHHDYKRYGVTTLFAVLDVLEGKVIGQCMKRHRHQEFIRFLNVIDARVAEKKMVHVIVDNYAAHKHHKVREWIESHPPFAFHFTPTSASWPNAVESFFAKLTKKAPQARRVRLPLASSTTPMQTQSPLPGPRTPTKSSLPSNEGTNC